MTGQRHPLADSPKRVLCFLVGFGVATQAMAASRRELTARLAVAEREVVEARRAMYAAVDEIHGRILDLQRRLRAAEQASSRRRLGVRAKPVSKRLARKLGLDRPRGCFVLRVFDRGEAKLANMKTGDVILEVDGTEVPGPAHLGKILATTRPERRVYVEVWRNGRVQILTLPSLVEAQRARVATLRGALERLESEVAQVEARYRSKVVRWESNVEALRTELKRHRAVEPSPTGTTAYTSTWVADSDRHRLGIKTAAVPPRVAATRGVSEGALVLSIQPGGPADQAGVRPNDIIVNLGGYRIASPQDLAERTASAPPYLPLYIRVARGGSHELLVAAAVSEAPKADELEPSYLKAEFRQTKAFEHRFWNLDQFAKWLRRHGKRVRLGGRTAYDFFGAADGGRVRFDGKKLECYVFEHTASFDAYDTPGAEQYYNVKCSDEGPSLY